MNRRLAYVALSRGRFDAEIFTDNKNRLLQTLGRDVSQRVAIDPNHTQRSAPTEIDRAVTTAQGFGLGL